MNLFLIFITGLTTGGLSCLAMQGGLLASVIANQKDQERDDILASQKNAHHRSRKERRKQLKAQPSTLSTFDQLDWMPMVAFLLAKLVSHTILGFLLGTLGSVITLSLGVRLFFQTFTALFMFATAMNLLNVHPIFRYVAFQPPKFLQRMIRDTSKSKALFAPAVLGFMTIFIPCGVTQAMEVLAINSGNAIQGAMIMFAFVLGTSPLFAGLGLLTARLSEGWYQRFAKFAAIVLIAMSVYGFNGVMVVLDSPITLQSISSPITYFFSEQRFSQSQTTETVEGVQKVTIQVIDSGYSPNYIKVAKGTPVELTLQSDNVYSCALSFVFKEFNIKTFLDSTDTQSFTFTPDKSGKFRFTCSMGMYSGVLEVI